MLPENDPHRMVSARMLTCYKCKGLVPPTIPFFDHSGQVCCLQCHMEMALEDQRKRAAVAREPKYEFGFTGYVPGDDPEWPEELDLDV